MAVPRRQGPIRMAAARDGHGLILCSAESVQTISVADWSGQLRSEEHRADRQSTQRVKRIYGSFKGWQEF